MGSLTIIQHNWLLLTAVGESYELWKPGTLRMSLCDPKVIFRSGTVFLCLKKNRSICEMKKGKSNNCSETSACFQRLLAAFRGPALLFSMHQHFPNLLWLLQPSPRPQWDDNLFACAHTIAAAGLGKVSWTNLPVWSSNTCDFEVYLQQISPVLI